MKNLPKKQTNMRVILASQSPQRKAILSTLGIEFEVKPADIDEQAITAATQKKRAELVARAKAETIAATFPQQTSSDLSMIIIAADTFVVDSADNPLEKPVDLDEARSMLRRMSGNSLVEYTGVCYLDASAGIDFSTTIATELTFRDLSAAEIEKYVTEEPVMTWSAAFCPAYDTGAALIAQVNGSMTSFTHGLPIEEIVPLLRKSGLEI
jgi:septum formation protein